MIILTTNNTIKIETAVLLAESRAEKIVARMRFSLAFACAVFSLYFFATNRTSFTLCAIQIGLLLAACLYSGIFLFESRAGPINKLVAYISVFFDVAVVTVYIWTLYSVGFPPHMIHLSAFPAYGVIIGFTALHNRTLLPIVCGALSLGAYFSLFFLSVLSVQRETGDLVILSIPGFVICILTTVLSVLIARNNRSAIVKLSSFEGRFSGIGSALPLMLFRIDRRGKFLWINAISHDRFGIDARKLIGQKIQHFIPDLNLNADTVPLHGTFSVTHFKPEIRHVDCIIQKQDDKEGEILEGSIVDVTDRERAISQREEMEQRLFQYQKMESLGTLASGMAHDFNNILQTITDITERVGNKTAEPFTRRDMALVSETLTDARFLISELLALGRKKPPTYGPVNLAIFLPEVVTLFSKQLGDLYQVNLDLKNDTLWIQGDADYLKRIFQNLFGNARDAMPEGGIITIECFSSNNTSGDKSVVIRFSDTGVGIPEGITEKVFDPFFTTKKKGKGTGLGLALVRRIVSQHKGVIFIEKSAPRGTTLRIELPEIEKSHQDMDTKTILIHRTSTTVLVLDDDPKMCNILNFFLSELSYKTCIALTMEEGLKEFKNNIDDCKVLIMDWKLKENDPHEVITRFRELKPDLIIIVVSGYQPLPQSIAKMNIFRWITKPYDKNRLDHEIQKALYFSAKMKK